MMGWRNAILAVIAAAFVAAACGCFGAAAQQQQKPARACGADEIARGTVGASSTAALSCSMTAARSASPRSKCRRLPSPHRSGRGAGRCGGQGGARRAGRRRRGRAAPRRERLRSLRPRRRLCLYRARWRRVLRAGRTDRGGFCPGRRPRRQQPAPRNCSSREQPPARPSLAYGPIRIMRCSTPRPLRMYWRIEADLRWSRAKWCPCAKAGRQST